MSLCAIHPLVQLDEIEKNHCPVKQIIVYVQNMVLAIAAVSFKTCLLTIYICISRMQKDSDKRRCKKARWVHILRGRMQESRSARTGSSRAQNIHEHPLRCQVIAQTVCIQHNFLYCKDARAHREALMVIHLYCANRLCNKTSFGFPPNQQKDRISKKENDNLVAIM